MWENIGMPHNFSIPPVTQKIQKPWPAFVAVFLWDNGIMIKRVFNS